MHLYAELLLNVKTLNVWLTIPPSDDSAAAVPFVVQCRFCCSGLQPCLIVSHQTVECVLRLPCTIPQHLNPPQELVVPSSGSLSLRFDLSQLSELANLAGDSWQSPWQAGDLQHAESICCGECRTILADVANITSWHDLPSENWAEMMDFWHCHKPDQPGGALSGHSKGYAAGNKLVARQSTGLVNEVTILISPTDAMTDRIAAADHPDQASDLTCTSCANELGYVDTEKQGWSLYKWSLAIIYNRQLQLFSVEKWISLFLMSKLEGFTLRKATVSSSNTGIGKAIEIWIVVPELWVSPLFAPGDHSGALVPAVKMLYREVDENAAKSRKPASFGEELLLPARLCNQLAIFLRQNQASLPRGATTMQDWQVSYLERFGP